MQRYWLFIFVLIGFIVKPCFLNAQIAEPNTNYYWQGIIVLKSGDTLSGWVKVPYDPVARNIKIKSSEDGSADKVDADNIASIIVKSDSGYVYLFERYRVKEHPNNKNPKKRPYFLLVIAKNDYATIYKVASVYVSNQDGHIYVISEYTGGSTMPYFTYCIRKKDEDFVSVFAETSPSKTVFGLKKRFVNRSKIVFADDPPLLEKIVNKELTLDDLDFIIEMYLNDMAGK
ncbi:MAG: hypothetical protein C0592_04465 [Marinilabiliales bacterium]|nr:MAG: hypothetical protein C0592_04465 [Marinilabiliales bacterium]